MWLAVLLKRLIVRGATSSPFLTKVIDPLCRIFVRVTGDTSVFTADVGLNAAPSCLDHNAVFVLFLVTAHHGHSTYDEQVLELNY